MALMAKEPSPVRFSERMEWYLAELVKLGVGKTRSELVRRFVWDGIERYIEKKLLPVKVRYQRKPAASICSIIWSR